MAPVDSIQAEEYVVVVFSNYLLLKVNCHNKMPATWHGRVKKFTPDCGLRKNIMLLCCCDASGTRCY